MSLTPEQKVRALSQRGIPCTVRAGVLTVHGDDLSEQELETAYAEWEAAETELAAEPTVDDVTRAIFVLAEGDDAVAKRISDKAAEIAQQRAR